MKIKKKTIKKISEFIAIAIEIMKLILNGLTEKEAINLTAKRHALSPDKVTKIWKKYKKNSIIT